MKIVIETYDALPCAIKTFKINSIDASIDDFGSVKIDHGQKDCYCYICGFEAKLPTQEVLDKYKISLKEYEEIVDKLDDVFLQGNCSWCS